MELLNHLFTLVILILLQAVLGFDNLLYISLESKNAPAEKQKYVRQLGIGLAIVLRIVLLFVLVSVIDYFQNPLFAINIDKVVAGEFNMHSLIVLVGGAFIIYIAVKEIWYMLSMEEYQALEKPKNKSVTKVIIMIVIMNLVFSFDSILSAMALTDVFWVMATAIIIGGILMIWLTERISRFLQKNRTYEVLGLFVLFLVGAMLVSEGGHLGHLYLFGSEVTAMSKTTFYFVLGVLVLVDVIQGAYKKKLAKEKERKQALATEK